MSNFNFVPPKKVLPIEQRAAQRKTFFATVCLSALLGLLPSLVVGYLVLDKQSKVSALEKKKSLLTLQINNQKEKIAQISIVKNKIEGIKYILSSQFDYSKTLEDLFRFLPAGVDLKTVDVDKNGIVKAELLTSDSSILKNFINELTRPDLKYKMVTIGDIVYRGKGSYSFAIGYKVDLGNKKADFKPNGVMP